ncbi:hypothetical protein K438DRAFT_1751276 [Mycena galopus ATCC 62051]|nr:hypothetical protein K438DRAFT_1751276 [Mycena galopus ATCC 62051]
MAAKRLLESEKKATSNLIELKSQDFATSDLVGTQQPVGNADAERASEAIQKMESVERVPLEPWNILQNQRHSESQSQALFAKKVMVTASRSSHRVPGFSRGSHSHNGAVIVIGVTVIFKLRAQWPELYQPAAKCSPHFSATGRQAGHEPAANFSWLKVRPKIIKSAAV